MTRRECEKLILAHLMAVRRIYHEYYTGGSHLSIYISNEGFTFFNRYWQPGYVDGNRQEETDYEHPINFNFDFE